MKNFIALMILYFIRFALWFRYRVTIKGEEYLNPKVLNKSGGVLFLPNHPTVFVDPTLITLAIWKKYPIRPMVVEYMYYAPVVNQLIKFMDGIPVPNFVNTSNSLKKYKAEKVIDTVIEELKKGDNFLIYPAGKVKLQAKEQVAGSGVPRIIQSVPEANVVLVRTTGLWGSSFSRGLTGNSPPMFAKIWWGIKKAFTNLIFFTPRREVLIEFLPAPQDFPFKGGRLEINRYLEDWYNKNHPNGEPLSRISFSMWKEELPEVTTGEPLAVEFNLGKIPEDVKNKIKAKLSEMTQIEASQIKPEMHLASDLGLDSLDNAELLSFLDQQFDIVGIPVNELTTVGKLMALADRQVTFGAKAHDELTDLSTWMKHFPHERATISPGETIPEVFLNTCQIYENSVICADERSGILTYSQMKLRVILLAEYIRKLPGKYIGILLPSSVGAYLVILATQMAGKIPLLVNWTVGSKHLESVRELSNVQVILSSWAFLDQLDNVDLTAIQDQIVTLEDAAREFGISAKLKAFIRSKKSTKSLLSLFGIDKKSANDEAVLLFTSGTESQPKGVPLSHRNILSNQRASVKGVDIYRDDILLGILPPFHSYGFTASGLLPLLAGVRVAFYPDPTDGKGVAYAVSKWKATIVCGAPTFLKGIFKNSESSQLHSLRLCVTGAEKAPQELFQMVKQLPHCRIVEGYGITECSPVISANMSGDPQYGVGKFLDNLEVCVVNLETYQEVSEGQQGLILVRGPSIFSGYLNKGVNSPFIEVNGKSWYSTGDLGYLDPRGNLILSGRLKRFIKVGGEMISLLAIEDALQMKLSEKKSSQDEHGPSLAVCAKEEAGEKTKIFVFTLFDTNIDEANRSLRDSGFSNLVKIYKIHQMDAIPLMGTGKINYRALDSMLPSLNGQS